jgi:hypothetical protein
VITLYPYAPPSFFTVLGSLSAVRALKRRGFPTNLRNWRFITLTIDRAQYPDPSEAYEVSKRHLRQFLYELRETYGIRRWCWKLEFHRADDHGHVYPHWHLLLDYKRPIPVDVITRAWGKGRTEVKGVLDQGFDYMFKYVAKSVENLPDWILSRTRVRLFQTSRGFFESPAGSAACVEELPAVPPAARRDSPDAATQNDWPRYVDTIGERIKRWSRCVVSRVTRDDGTKRFKLHIAIGADWADVLVDACRFKFAHQLGEPEIRITTNKIEASCLQSFPQSLLLYRTVSS